MAVLRVLAVADSNLIGIVVSNFDAGFSAGIGTRTPFRGYGHRFVVIDAAEIIRTGTSILFVTLDSLRYDVARTARDDGLTPRLESLLPEGGWERRHTPGSFTFPAHMAFFSGFLPKLPQPEQPPRLWECRPPAFKTVPKETRFRGVEPSQRSC